MKIIVVFLFLSLSSFHLFGQISLQEWNEMSKTDIRLLPKYGNHIKTPEQKKSDSSFINSIMKMSEFEGDRSKASNHLIKLGFNYMSRRDIKTAMYRFNQAYLLDSTNTNIYWGYGVVYMTLGDSEKGKKLYEEGLKLNPNNTNILTDYGSYFLGEYYKNKNSLDLDRSISFLLKAYQMEGKNDDTNFKLSICYWLKKDCDNAWKYISFCKDIESLPNGKSYLADLEISCKKTKQKK